MELTRNRNRFSSLPALALILGGLLMAGLWVVYTNVHGPTSYDETNDLLGRSTLFWGSMLSAPPSLLVVFGWLLVIPPFAQGSRLARAGFWMTAVAMLVPALVDLVFVFLSPPLLLPLVGIGLILTSVGLRRDAAQSVTAAPKPVPVVLLAMGVLLLASILWAIIPKDLSDRLYGYRIYGFAAHLLFGLGWIVVGVTLLRNKRAGAA